MFLSQSYGKANHSGITARLLLDASGAITDGKPTVVVNGVVENFDQAVNRIVESGLLKRVPAQTEIQSSNSMIESWWRVLKQQWLYLNQLESLKTVEKPVTFYVEQRNSSAALGIQSPDALRDATRS